MADEAGTENNQTPIETLRDRVFLALGSIGAVVWFSLFVLKELGLFPITYEGLAVLGFVVGGLLQIEFIPSVFAGLK